MDKICSIFVQIIDTRGISFTDVTNDLQVQVDSRSLVFVPFDRPHMISYLSSIVTVSISHHFGDIVAYFQIF